MPFLRGSDTREMEETPTSVEAPVSSLDLLASNRILARELRRQEAVFRALPDGVLLVDNSEHAVFANSNAAAYLTCSPADIHGRRVRECLRDPDVAALLSSSHGDQGGGLRSVELPAGEDGRPDTTVLQSTVTTDDGNSYGQLLIFRNVSRIKSMERLQREFVDSVAHELRTPLTSIRAYVELLIDGEAEDEDAKRNFYNVIYEETYRLSHLIDNLLNISMMESGVAKLDVTPTRIKRVIEEALEVIRAPSEARGVTIAADLPDRLPTLNIDKSLFSVALMNILSNAAKFTPDGGAISVTTASREQEFHIVVSDTGIGVPPEEIDRIFEKFYRSASAQQFHGSGVGLSTALQIMRLHGGTIRVASRPGEGTHFTLALPRTLINTSIGD